MRIRHRKVSSFLNQKRKERLNKSQMSGELLNLSMNDSILDKSSGSIQFSLTERSERQSNADEYAPSIDKMLEDGYFTDRIVIPEEKFEGLMQSEIAEEKVPIEPERENSPEKKKDFKEHEEFYEEKLEKNISISKINIILSVFAAGLVIGGIVYVIKKKKNP
ncbi:hypothetical protein SteCoe_7988 [Stentor coeruleus]|uniref:Uncharacterized protein n=1 Tax=Stentor coeruleus TaxID=5963 RepID=A0A1R2CLI4_9CILI|nr:hypothetical protein SteCoe_7988 [Stentor coeruleus]